jgi:hypothetical protein
MIRTAAEVLFVPSPLAEEGKDGGCHSFSSALRPLTLSLCGALINQGPTGRGNPYSKD